MKKLIIVASLMVALSINAAVTSTTVATTTCSNLVTFLSGGGTISSITFQSPPANVGSAKLYDSDTTSLTYTQAAYTTITVYATNLISSWTNYYGVVNNATNIVLMQATNTVAAVTNSPLPLLLTMTGGTNTTVTYSGINANFSRGLAVTNTGAGTITVTVTYTQ